MGVTPNGEMMFRRIQECRLCDGPVLRPVLNLGTLALTGVFPKTESTPVAEAPLEVVQCATCHLVQLRENFDLGLLYGDTYGYRSGLNSSMVRHLQEKVRRIERLQELRAGDLVVDIGSNDGTLLGCYQERALRRVGVDPIGRKFYKYYQPGIELIPEFFSAKAVAETLGRQRAKVVTSIAMFYDLERPLEFVQAVMQTLDDDGIWVFEQSYLPAMLATNSYDTICHEHLEYYSLHQIVFLAERAGLKIVDVEFNDANGGSFSVTASPSTSRLAVAQETVDRVLENERAMGLDTPAPFARLKETIDAHRKELRELLGRIKADRKTVLGYGASTKGNVLLQYCGIDRNLLPAIAEVNEDKFGSYTPGTGIPIISESDARAAHPDYYLALPWHFRKSIIERERIYLSAGGTLIFPLPQLELVSAEAMASHVS
jgi:hypothetical protein